MRPLDTSPEIHRMQIERYRSMTGEERVLEMIELTNAEWARKQAEIRTHHPDYGEEEVIAAFRRWRFGDDLFLEVWPEAPLLDP